MQEIIINSNEAGQRFDKFLFKYFKEASAGFIYKMLRKKNIVLNDKKSDGKNKLNEGDSVKIYMSDETIDKFCGSEKCYLYENIGPAHPDIVYEDCNVIIINKPAGILSQKAVKDDISVNEYIISYLISSQQLTYEQLKTFTPGVCNRLDRNTSGLIIAGKSLAGLQIMSEMLKNRTMDKYYLTLVSGIIKQKQTIKGFLIKNSKFNTVYIQAESRDGGQYIETEYEPVGFGDNITLLKVKLITGRAHQIRAHLASVKHPVIGDYKYGNKKINDVYRQKYGLEHQLLHSWEMHFPEMHNACSDLSEKIITANLPIIFSKIIDENIKLI